MSVLRGPFTYDISRVGHTDRWKAQVYDRDREVVMRKVSLDTGTLFSAVDSFIDDAETQFCPLELRRSTPENLRP